MRGFLFGRGELLCGAAGDGHREEEALQVGDDGLVVRGDGDLRVGAFGDGDELWLCGWSCVDRWGGGGEEEGRGEGVDGQRAA